jgi:Protein of unknown function (DUF1592)/Protein of unknown function (DUF1588)/Protein of unknown function (DUF1587)/Protein of unknown function (DUF1595)/Protein of unknown function (DUF1585)
MANEWRVGRFAFLIPLFSGLVAACSGEIGQPTNGSTGMGGVIAPPKAADYIDQSSPALIRLTNAEYSQTVADLLGEAPDAAVRYRFPVDSTKNGFDNNTDLLHVSGAHSDAYAAAAAGIAAATFAAPDRRAKILNCDVAADPACLKRFIQTLGRRMYRRPLSDAEVTVHAALVTDGDPSVVLEMMLQSPFFLYRVQSGVPVAGRSNLVGLDGFQMATRLSYLLWGTTPDDALLDKAQAGQLDSAEGVAALAQQMLADPRGRAGVKRFYGQWLPLTQIAGPTADPTKFPKGDAQLASDMADETSRFVESILMDGGGKVSDLLTARYSFVNSRVAAVYGVPAPAQAWQRVDWAADVPRAGLLTQGSILAATSHGIKPSATKRGQFVRENLLCADIPSPPPGVSGIVPDAKPGETEQETFARHTTVATCASCHTQMDPIGWGLGQFDGNGAFRTKDSNGQPIATKGFVDGLAPRDFDGPLDLATRVGQSDTFKKCFASQLFRYAYGRVEVDTDAAGIDQLYTAFEGAQWGFTKGFLSLVEADGFRFRNKGDAP